MISRLACWGSCHKVYLFLFQQHTHLQVNHKPLVLTFSFFCLLQCFILSLEDISPPASNCLSGHLMSIGLMLHAVSHCGNMCGVRLLVSFFLFFFSPASDWLGVLHASHCSDVHSWLIYRECVLLRKMESPHGSWGPTHSMCSVCREGQRWFSGMYKHQSDCSHGLTLKQK